MENDHILLAASQLYKVVNLYDVTNKITGSAFYPSIADSYSETEGMPFIRVSDLGNFFINENSFIRLPEHLVEDMRQISTVEEDDLVIAKGGTIGGVCLVQEGLGTCAVSRDVIAIKTNPKYVDVKYLLAFLRSQIGQLQFDRYKSQQVQAHLTFPAVGNVKVVLPPQNLQKEVAELVDKSRVVKQESINLYAEAEALLLHELGLDRLDLEDEIAYVGSFSEMMSANRLDAEYFQPKYSQILDAIKALKPKAIVPLEQLLKQVTNGHTPYYHDLSVGDVIFLTAEHISDFRINYDSEKRILIEHHLGELKRTRLNEGDILVTIKGRIGNAAVVENLREETNINQDVALLRLKSNYHPYYVISFLNSLLGKTLVDQICTGQINPFLSLTNLKKISIPIFEDSLMNYLGDKVQQTVASAYASEMEAAQLLEQAKTRVENMILGV